MNRKSLFITIGVVSLLLVATFWAGKAFATTGCFSDTNGHWAETFICWLKDNDVSTGYGDGTYRPENNITRAEMAVMLQRQAEVPPDKGLILITPGNGNWLKYMAADDISFNYRSSHTEVMKATLGDAWISIQPSVPTVLYGRDMQLVGVDFCYTASTDTYLSIVELETFTSTAGEAHYDVQANDSTVRTDSACRYYELPAPVTLTPIEGVTFWVYVHWNAGGTKFNINRTTFVLQPTSTLAVFSPSLTDAVVTLSETDATGEVQP
jgi:hypothetical protein